MRTKYYRRILEAYITGLALRSPALADEIRKMGPDGLAGASEETLQQLLDGTPGKHETAHAFKNSQFDLPRVQKALGFLKSIQPESLLDVGSGRGVFLFPFLELFPETQVWSVDLLAYRVEALRTIRDGGYSRLHPAQADVCRQPLPDNAVEVVTMLEVLEHIPDVQAAVTSAVRMASRAVLVSVPSKPDHNPEHIHLLTRPVLTELFENAGCGRLHFDGVNGHLILTAVVS